MKLKYTSGTVQAILTNIDTHDKITLEAVPSGPADEEGVTLFTYQTWSLPNQVDHVICLLIKLGVHPTM